MCVDNNVEAKIDIFMYSFLIFDFYLILETRFKKKKKYKAYLYLWKHGKKEKETCQNIVCKNFAALGFQCQYWYGVPGSQLSHTVLLCG